MATLLLILAVILLAAGVYFIVAQKNLVAGIIAIILGLVLLLA